MDKIIRSPFFYVGDKYKLMKQINDFIPSNINRYIDPFCGGGSSFLNIKANEYLLNDIDKHIIMLHKWLISYIDNQETLFHLLFNTIDKYNLSCSLKENVIPIELKKEFPKTYFSKYNRNSYTNMKNDYNKNNDTLLLYLLLIYGFNHMIRFNKNGEFNLPVGNIDFNKNVYNAIKNYLSFCNNKTITFYNDDFKNFLNKISFKENDFIFVDPPYLISMSEYNKLWNEEKEKELYQYLDELNKNNIKFGVTNLIEHKNEKNPYFEDFSKKYNFHIINSNYISFNNNIIKKNSKELFVTNF